MRRALATATVAVMLCTLVLGLVYPLALTGVGRALFPGRAGGSLLHRDGRVVGSALLAQRFTGAAWFAPRPSQTGWNAAATAFSNRGPDQRAARAFYAAQIAAYLRRERPYDPGLTRAEVPVDAVTTSGSGVDPDISPANAAIQARRVAAVRGLALGRVRRLVAEHTGGRVAGLLGVPGVDVTALNLALAGARR